MNQIAKWTIRLIQIALVIYFNTTWADFLDGISGPLQVQAEHLIWDEKESSARDLEIIAGTLSLFSKKATLTKPATQQNRYILQLENGLGLCSDPSMINAFLPFGAKMQLSLKTFQARLELDEALKWQRVELQKDVQLSANLKDDPLQPRLEGERESQIQKLSFNADKIAFNRESDFRIDHWQLAGILTGVSPYLDKFSCRAEYLDGNAVKANALIGPQFTCELPHGHWDHRGDIAASCSQAPSPLSPSSLKLWKWSAPFLRGNGIVTGDFSRPELDQKLTFCAPGGLELNPSYGQLRFLGDTENPIELTVKEKALTAELKAGLSAINWVRSEPGLDPFQLLFEQDVQLKCADGKKEKDQNPVFQHLINADQLICHPKQRSFVFKALFDTPVRYFNVSKNLRISAPTLSLECPPGAALRIQGKGIVRAQLKAPSELLRSRPSPFSLNEK